ncbi:Putative N-acetyl-LL-diaminopimelate aminotransferase [Corynebacterium ciconiae DSM 44920]|uniref:pyridoxal phosphate-dependent aminotransferase n=1 Tax=Corynebacterium ciconiae TaxID=227319 RepID=UPI000378FC15|nr:Putative N-acetyl-LL-diaminopimelate aminotransferase [Corynebacterium ciconiae DSM 44920]
MDILGRALERQSTHGDALLLCVGQPSTGAPSPVVAQAETAVREDILGYTAASGTPELKEAIAGYYRRRYGVEVDPRRILITTGSSGGFTSLFLAVCDAGDEVVLARPGYPAYRNVLQALGVKLVEIDVTDPEHGFQLRVEDLEACTPRPRAVIVTSPSNPSGTVMDPAELRRLAQWCDENGVVLISDEIYHGISYGAECRSAAEFTDRAVIVGSVSKYFSMTGWRVGWLIVPPELVEPLDRLHANFTVCPPALSQQAAVKAFDHAALEELDAHVQRYARNREILLTRLPAMGLGRIAPADGAFYCYVDVSSITADSFRFAHELLDATGVAVAPGVDFDPVQGQRWIRLSYACDTDDIEAAMDRLEAYIRA